jgi:hypothetical protein
MPNCLCAKQLMLYADLSPFTQSMASQKYNRSQNESLVEAKYDKELVYQPIRNTGVEWIICSHLGERDQMPLVAVTRNQRNATSTQTNLAGCGETNDWDKAEMEEKQ